MSLTPERVRGLQWCPGRGNSDPVCWAQEGKDALMAMIGKFIFVSPSGVVGSRDTNDITP